MQRASIEGDKDSDEEVLEAIQEVEEQKASTVHEAVQAIRSRALVGEPYRDEHKDKVESDEKRLHSIPLGAEHWSLHSIQVQNLFPSEAYEAEAREIEYAGDQVHHVLGPVDLSFQE